MRASSLAYSFFLSLFPFLLFLLTLIAYVPVDNLKEEFLTNMELVLPSTTFSALEGTVKDILQNQRGGLLSLGLIASIYISSNGLMTIITALNRHIDKRKRRSLIQKRALAIGMTIVLIVILLVVAAALLYMGMLQSSLEDAKILPSWLLFVLFLIIKVGVLMFTLYVVVSGIYYFAPCTPRKEKVFHFVSPGSTLTTILIVITTLILQYYINNINSYNSVYGSIGAVIALLILMYFNASCILIGFELNRSIDRAINAKLESRPFIIRQMD